MVSVEVSRLAANAIDYLIALEDGRKGAYPVWLLHLADCAEDDPAPLLFRCLAAWKAALAEARERHAAFMSKRQRQRSAVLSTLEVDDTQRSLAGLGLGSSPAAKQPTAPPPAWGGVGGGSGAGGGFGVGTGGLGRDDSVQRVLFQGHGMVASSLGHGASDENVPPDGAAEGAGGGDSYRYARALPQQAITTLHWLHSGGAEPAVHHQRAAALTDTAPARPLVPSVPLSGSWGAPTPSGWLSARRDGAPSAAQPRSAAARQGGANDDGEGAPPLTSVELQYIIGDDDDIEYVPSGTDAVADSAVSSAGGSAGSGSGESGQRTGAGGVGQILAEVAAARAAQKATEMSLARCQSSASADASGLGQAGRRLRMTGHGLVLGQASPPPPAPMAAAAATEADTSSGTGDGKQSVRLQSELARAKEESQAIDERLRKLGFCMPLP